MDRPSDRPLRAFAWMVASALAFSIMSVFVKRLGGAIPEMELVFFRSASNLVFAGLLLLAQGQTFVPDSRMRGILMLRGLGGFGGIFCLFYSVGHLPLAIASMLAWSSPLFVILFSRIFLGEVLSKRILACIAAAFVGLTLLLNPGASWQASGLSWTGVSIGLLGAAFSGSAYLLVRAATALLSPALIVFYFMATATVISAPFAILHFRAPEAAQALELLALSVAAFAGQVAMTRGYQNAAAGRVSSMSLLTTAFSALIGWLFFAENLAAIQWAGMSLMTAALAILTWSSNAAEQGASRIKLRYEYTDVRKD